MNRVAETSLSTRRLGKGRKVQVRGLEGLGFGEVVGTVNGAAQADVHFYCGPLSFEAHQVPVQSLNTEVGLPAGTRCYLSDGAANLAGVVVEAGPPGTVLRRYRIQLERGESVWRMED